MNCSYYLSIGGGELFPVSTLVIGDHPGREFSDTLLENIVLFDLCAVDIDQYATSGAWISIEDT